LRTMCPTRATFRSLGHTGQVQRPSSRPRRAPELVCRPTAGHAGRSRPPTPAGPRPPPRAGQARGPAFPAAGGGRGGDTARVPGLTQLLDAAAAGDRQAPAALLPLVYDELRRLAAHRLARESPGHTLQPTALVHEAYLRLAREPGAAGPRWA